MSNSAPEEPVYKIDNRYALMSLADLSKYKSVPEKGGKWIQFEDDHLRLYSDKEALESDPGEDCIFVEILNLDPDFPMVACLHAANREILAKDMERWSPQLNRVFYDPHNDEYNRLVGIHIDSHDFYFRMRNSDGSEKLFSMVMSLIPASDSLNENDLKELDDMLVLSGCSRASVFFVTREIDKPWPRQAAPAAHLQILSREGFIIFGPFSDPEEFEDFKEAIKSAPGIGLTTGWKDRFEKEGEYRNKSIPEEIWTKSYPDMSQDEMFEAMIFGLGITGDDGPTSFKL